MRIPSQRLPSCAAFCRSSRSFSAALIFAGVLSCVAGMAQTAPGRTTPGSPAQGNKGAHEGIKVSGYWKIDVHNRDGSLARHVEFENSLTVSGILQNILAGGLMVFGTSIVINPGTPAPVTNDIPILYIPESVAGESVEIGLPFLNSGPCAAPQATSGTNCILSTSSDPLYNNCLYMENNTSRQATVCLATLTTSTAASQLVLNGSFTVGEYGGSVNIVGTLVSYCPQPPPGQMTNCTLPAQVGSSPTEDLIAGLTEYTLPTPMTLSAGQAVNVSVTLSFQ